MIKHLLFALALIVSSLSFGQSYQLAILKYGGGGDYLSLIHI